MKPELPLHTMLLMFNLYLDEDMASVLTLVGFFYLFIHGLHVVYSVVATSWFLRQPHPA